jgi:cytochrome c oxidase cbb3-type subunit 4
MDITTLRIATTVVGFLCFLGIVLWVFDRQKTKRFDEAAQLPFLDE